MKNLKRILSFFIVMGFMFVMFGFRVGVKATDQTWDWATATYDSASTDEVSWTSTYVNMKLEKNTSTTKANNYLGGSGTYVHTRVYQNQKITFTVLSGYQIDSIKIVATDGTYAGYFVNATWTNATASKSSSNVTVTPTTKTSPVSAVIGTATRATSVTVSYSVVSLEPSIEVTGTNHLMVGGETVSLTATPSNITPAPSSFTWSSSNTNVATVSNTGVVTAMAMGTTNITATASGTTSAAYAVKVYPSNTTPISIATAVEIATLAGTTAAPYKYISSGAITDVADHGHSYTLTDGSGNITVYKKNHGKDINDVVTIQGDLINYGGNTIEYNNIAYCYDVTFNANGGTGSFGPYNNVVSGTKISNPGTPTKDGNTFLGWFNGNDEWNFANDTVTSPLTLTAKWASDAVQTAINNALESANAYMSLAYGYTLNKIDNPETYTKATSASHLSAGDSVIIISKFGSNYYVLKNNNGSAVPSEAITITNDEIDSIDSSCVWTLEGNLIDGWNLKNNSLYLYNPSSTTLNLHNSNKTTFSFTINGNNAYFESSDRAMMYYEKDATKSFKHYALSNYGKAEYAEEMYVFVKQATAKYLFREVDFRIRCAIDDSLSELNEDYAVAFGIEVSAGGNTVRYGSGSGAIFQTAGSKCFVTLDLNDMLNEDYDKLDTEFTVRAYVVYQGAYFYSTNTKTYSVKGMVDYYYNNQHIDAVSGLKEILENYGYTFE